MAQCSSAAGWVAIQWKGCVCKCEGWTEGMTESLTKWMNWIGMKEVKMQKLWVGDLQVGSKESYFLALEPIRTWKTYTQTSLYVYQLQNVISWIILSRLHSEWKFPLSFTSFQLKSSTSYRLFGVRSSKMQKRKVSRCIQNNGWKYCEWRRQTATLPLKELLCFSSHVYFCARKAPL